MNKGLIASIIVIGFLAFLFFAGRTASKQTTSATQNEAAISSAFALTETFYDFGTISMKDGKVSRMFSLVNSGEASQTIKRISTSCMCTEAFLVGQDDSRRGPFGMPGHGGFGPDINDVVSTGEKRNVEVIFDPAAHGPAGVGRIERAVFVEDGNGGTQTLTVKALVTP